MQGNKLKQLSHLQKNKIFSSFIQVFAVIVIPISVLLTYERINDSHYFPISTVRISGNLTNIESEDIEKLIKHNEEQIELLINSP